MTEAPTGTSAPADDPATPETAPEEQPATTATPSTLRVPDSIAARAQARLDSGKRCLVRVVPSHAAFLGVPRVPASERGA